MFHYLCIRFKQADSGLSFTGQSWHEHCKWILWVLQTEPFPHGFDLQKVVAQGQLSRSSVCMWRDCVDSLLCSELLFQISGWVLCIYLYYGKIKYYQSRIWLANSSNWDRMISCYGHMQNLIQIQHDRECIP